jgi:hypothetical protein
MNAVELSVWASLARIRGWREHREYLGILRALPADEKGRTRLWHTGFLPEPE